MRAGLTQTAGELLLGRRQPPLTAVAGQSPAPGEGARRQEAHGAARDRPRDEAAERGAATSALGTRVITLSAYRVGASPPACRLTVLGVGASRLRRRRDVTTGGRTPTSASIPTTAPAPAPVTREPTRRRDIDNNVGIDEGADTCIGHAGVDVTSPPRRFRKNLYHEIREAGRARASAEDSRLKQSRAAIGPFFDHRWSMARF